MAHGIGFLFAKHLDAKKVERENSQNNNSATMKIGTFPKCKWQR